MRFLVGLLLLAVVFETAVARDIAGLYRASVAVTDQSEAERARALQLTLVKVIQKVTGRKAMLVKPDVEAAFASPASFVEQYQYAQRDVSNELVDTALEPAYTLSVLFNKASVDAVLKQYNIPVWGRNRPAVLAWIAVENKQGERFLLAPEKALAVQQISQAGINSGLGFTLPLMDLQDQRSLTFRDVWGGFSERIQSASERYGAEQVLYARFLQQATGQWLVRWSLLNPQQRKAGEFKQISFHEAAEVMAVAATAELANIYAPEGLRSKQNITMEVEGAENLASLARVYEYLQSLDIVEKVTWQHVQLGKVEFELTYQGRLDVLKETIKLNKILREVIAPPKLVSAALEVAEGSRLSLVTESRLYYKVGP